MILCYRGVAGTAFEAGEILEDERAIEDARRLAARLYDVARLVPRDYAAWRASA